jgi:dTDP-4-amino-4,6-dideoxygalactose transaminase
VERAITPSTTAILAVHVYGHPCRLAKLADIAKRRGLKLIYDAAHAFGVTVNGRSIGRYGDLSMFSFHATKHFHSIEGGLLVCADPGQRRVFDHLRNFGFESETEVIMPGTNAKMNEFQALMGLQVLQHLDAITARRQAVDALYRARLEPVPGIVMPALPPANTRHNFAFFPVEIDKKDFGLSRDELYEALKRFNIHTRRYFYPLLPDLACYRDVPHADPLTTARRVANRILALPIYDSLPLEDVERICDCVMSLRPRRPCGGPRRRRTRRATTGQPSPPSPKSGKATAGRG